MIYSTSFFCGTMGSGVVTVYTVPQNSVVVVRDIEVYINGSGVISPVVQAIVSGSTGVIWTAPVDAGKWAQWQGRAVIPAGGELQTYGGGTTLVAALISGYLLT